jgi:hypothetical protein
MRTAPSDDPVVDDAAAGLRAGAGPPRVALRRLPGWVGTGLYRPLADEEARARYWMRHVRTGVLLSEVAGLAALGAAVRETDTVARMGGDEFAVLASCPAPDDDAALAGRLRAAVAEVGAGCGVTASVGCALVHPDDAVVDVLHRADAAMYRAKAAGGDRVHDLAR